METFTPRLNGYPLDRSRLAGRHTDRDLTLLVAARDVVRAKRRRSGRRPPDPV